MLYNLPLPPQYFFFDSLLNREANLATFDSVLNHSNHPLKLPEFEKTIEDKETLVLDTRDISEIANAHVPSSLGISLKCPFNSWVGKLVKPKTNIVMVCENGTEKEAITQLSRIGYDSVSGYLEGGFKTWKESNKPTSEVKLVQPEEMLKIVEDKSHTLVDVREPGEWEGGVVGEPLKVSLTSLEKRLNEIPNDKDLYIYCRSGMRGVMAVTSLQRYGFTNTLYNVVGGYDKMKEKGVPTHT
jgi:rhodanese-related sulfurtransferase